MKPEREEVRSKQLYRIGCWIDLTYGYFITMDGISWRLYNILQCATQCRGKMVGMIKIEKIEYNSGNEKIRKFMSNGGARLV